MPSLRLEVRQILDCGFRPTRKSSHPEFGQRFVLKTPAGRPNDRTPHRHPVWAASPVQKSFWFAGIAGRPRGRVSSTAIQYRSRISLFRYPGDLEGEPMFWGEHSYAGTRHSFLEKTICHIGGPLGSASGDLLGADEDPSGVRPCSSPAIMRKHGGLPAPGRIRLARELTVARRSGPSRIDRRADPRRVTRERTRRKSLTAIGYPPSPGEPRCHEMKAAFCATAIPQQQRQQNQMDRGHHERPPPWQCYSPCIRNQPQK